MANKKVVGHIPIDSHKSIDSLRDRNNRSLHLNLERLVVVRPSFELRGLILNQIGRNTRIGPGYELSSY